MLGKILEKNETKRFEKPDEVRTFDKGKVELVNVGGLCIGKATFEPGWKWSTCVKPLVKTATCEAAHLGYILSGTLKTRMNDGTEILSRPGDVVNIPSGHDGWVEGDEKVVLLDFQGLKDYAKKTR